MSWAIGYDENWCRDVGYGVPAVCDHPECNESIDRGLSYVCGGDPFGGDKGCGLYFCGKHRSGVDDLCGRCARHIGPFDAKPDVIEWVRWKLTHESWAQWRRENVEQVEKLKQRLAGDV
jgi:hypothetical protein